MFPRKFVLLLPFAACFLLFASGAAHAQFGQNVVNWDNKEYRIYESYHFDVFHAFDLDNVSERSALEELVGTLEAAYAWMSGEAVFGHAIENRIPVIVTGTHSEFEVEVARITGSFVSEGVGAMVEANRHRMITKKDALPALSGKIDIHELVHVFQFDIGDPGFLKGLVGLNKFPRGYYEGCAEYVAGLYDPHTRDDIMRRDQRMAAANTKRLLPTWDVLKNGSVNPYTMWSMIPEFLEDQFSSGLAFCTKPLKNGTAGLGEFIYDAAKGRLGNPDANYEKFDQEARAYWSAKFEADSGDRPKPYGENENFKGRSVAPFGHPYPMLSPALSPDGARIACFTVIDGDSVALVVFDIPPEGVYVSKDERNKNEKARQVFLQNGGNKLLKNLTSYLPPEPWEYLVVQGFYTGPFNGFDLSWSRDGKKIAFFARINRDHALVIIEADTGKITKKIELENFLGEKLDQAFSPSFSPDGNSILFSAMKNGVRDLYAVDLASEPLAWDNYTGSDRSDTAPSISPDGSKAVYIGSDGDFQHLFLLDLPTGDQRQLTFGRFNDGWPSWSDDGQTIVYSSDEADKIWSIYTFNLNDQTVRQWTEFFGGAESPIFARSRNDLVYYVVYRDDDQFQSLIYPNFEIFEAQLKKPIREYVVRDTGPAGRNVFIPARDLFKFDLDENQFLNLKSLPERWDCRGRNVQFGASSYWGMFGQSYLDCSNILETKHHQARFAFQGGNFRIVDYSYLNLERRLNWSLGAYQRRLPLYYAFYDIVERAPDLLLLRYTVMDEYGLNASIAYPVNKFNRWEFFSRVRHLGYDFIGVDESAIADDPNLSGSDIGLYRNLTGAEGSNFIFGAAFVRDTVICSASGQCPWHGNALRVEFEAAPHVGREFGGYVSADIQARTYRKLSDSTLVAGRLEAMTTSKANGDFVLMGGPERLRGVDYGSIVCNQCFYASAELRFPIIDAIVAAGGLNVASIRGLLFFDGAVARLSGQELPVQKIKAYGAGLQYPIPFIGLPAQTVWTRNNGKWIPSFYITIDW